MRFNTLSLLFVAILNIILGVLVVSRNTKSRDNGLFFFVCISVAMWATGLAGFLYSSSFIMSIYWAKIYYIAAALIGLSLVLFSSSYSRAKNFFSTVPKIACGLAMILISLLIVDNNFLASELRGVGAEKIVVLDKSDYLIFSAYFIATFAWAFFTLFNNLLHAKGVKRSQARHVFLSVAIAGLFGMFFNLALPWIGNYSLIWVGPQFSVLFVASITYAIVRHKLFDIKLIVIRSITYTATFGTIVVAYYLVLFTLSQHLAGIDDLSSRSRGVLIGITILSSLSYVPIKRFFDNLTKRIFYRDAYEVQTVLDKLGQILVGNVDLDVLIKEVLQLLDDVLHFESAKLILFEKDEIKSIEFKNHENKTSKLQVSAILKELSTVKEYPIVFDNLEEGSGYLKQSMRSLDVSVILRAQTHETTVGYLMFGAKLSGKAYTPQDIKLLSISIDELAIALQNALRFEEIANFNTTLQKTVDDRTRELKRSNDKLQALDTAKDEFISMASHQLRTPLTSVKGYVSMVLEGDAGPITDQQRQLLQQSFVSSQRMVYLIADLLNVSRLRTGKFVIEAKPTYLPDVVQSEIEQLADTAKARNLEVSFVRPDKFPMLMLDETKIRQVIMNFADNAIYYTPSGGKIEIVLRETQKAIEFDVKDSGIGVPKHEQHHLFTKFYRANNAKKARPDGTGLGLFMAKKVIVAQGGSVVFRSTEGKGSTFGFTFPKQKLLVGGQSNTAAKTEP